MGSGPSKQTTDTQSSLTQAQTQIAQQANVHQEEDRTRSLELTQPLIDKEKALATGDRTAALSAAMPTISQLTAGYKGARDSVFNMIPAGASRDKALADLEVQKAVGTGGAMAGEVAKAPELLANIGQGYGAFSLQELGASLGGYAGASGSNQATAKMQSDASSAKWAPIVGLAGAAGGALGGTKLWGK